MKFSHKYKLTTIFILLSIILSYGNDADNPTTKYDSLIMQQKKLIETAEKGTDTTMIDKVYWELGILYAENNDIEKALLAYKKALSLAEKNGNRAGMYHIYEMMGELLSREPRYYDIAEMLYKKSIEINSCDFYTACFYYHIGDIRFKENKIDESEDYILKSNSIAKRLDTKHLMSNNYEMLGCIYERKSKNDLAIENYQKCFETGCPNCPKIRFFNSIIKSADLYLYQSNKEKAVEYYNKALLLAKEFNAPKELAIANLKIGNLYRGNGKEKPGHHYQIAYDEAQKAGNKLVLKIISDTLANFYKELGEYEKALYYRDVSFKLQDTLNNASGKEEMAKLATNIEFNNLIEEIKQENDSAQKVIVRQKSAKKTLLAFTVLLILVLSVIIYQYNKKRKKSCLLALQNTDLEVKNKQFRTELGKIKDDYQRLLLGILESEIQADKVPNGEIVNFDKKLLANCQQIIYNNISNPEFTVKTLANEMGMNRRNVYRKTKELLDCTPSDLIKSCRMRYASQLITQKSLRVSEVASLVGYEDAKRFSQAFKLFFGQNPSDFLNNNSNILG